MKSKPKVPANTDGPLEEIQRALSGKKPRRKQLGRARDDLLAVAQSAHEAGRTDVASCAKLLAAVLEIASCCGDDTETDKAVTFTQDALAPLQSALESESDEATGLTAVIEQGRERWGEYLDLVTAAHSPGSSQNPWQDPTDAANPKPEVVDGNNEPEGMAPDAAPVDVGLILSTLENAVAAHETSGWNKPDHAPAAPANPQPVQQSGTTASDTTAASACTDQPDGSAFSGFPPPPDRIEIDEELLAAYLDDAGKCLASMEECLLAFEEDAGNRGILRQFCRELHTLKGASASVGLTNLAKYLHELEDYVDACCSLDEPVQSVVGLNRPQQEFVEACCNRDATIDVDTLLKGIDAVHTQVGILTGEDSNEATRPTGSDENAKISDGPSLTRDATPSRSDEFVRVEASRLDRLMDLLAGLVMLRNRRETGVTQLKQLHSELNRYVGRLRAFDDRVASVARGTRGALPAADSNTSTAEHQLVEGYRASSLAEMCSDMSELGRTLREVFDPLAEDNLAVSRLIGQFRQELMELRRLPVAGLLRRLHRGARDAARSEGKQVHLEFDGENAGLERALQERLYEPLLHVVRNAVSHGIETPQERVAAGKPPVGTMTLRAHSDASSLVFEVRDDGRGLDYEAVERRGRELGLLSPNHRAGREQLAKLIFYPGFSTRQEVSEISGRGVGMDVVTQVVDRMRGQVDVDSVPGRGTTVRLRIPLSSGIEHAMVVRVGGQLFGLPMQHVHGANSTLLDVAAPGGSSASAQRPSKGDRETVSSTASGSSAATQRGDLTVLRLRDLVGLQPTMQPGQEQVLIVGYKPSMVASDAQSDVRRTSRYALVVDDVVGAEEVVVRSLPPLLRSHRLFAGVTLSGDGEAVLLFDVPHLLEGELRGAPSPTGGHWIPHRASRGEHRILVVDDSLSTRRSLCQMLKRAGLDFKEAADGLEALDVLRTNAFLGVLTDLEMPRLGGFELLAEVKRGRRTKHLPVIVITSRGDATTRTRAHELGADGFITKPVSTASLEEILAVLEQRLSEASTDGAIAGPVPLAAQEKGS